MKEQYLILSYAGKSIWDTHPVYLKEITDRSGMYLYASWTENIEEAKLFDTAEEALSYDKHRIGNSIYSFSLKGITIRPTFEVCRVYRKIELEFVDRVSIEDQYRRVYTLEGDFK